MNAQQLIDQTEQPTDFLRAFYLDIWKQEQAQEDLSLCLRRFK